MQYFGLWGIFRTGATALVVTICSAP